MPDGPDPAPRSPRRRLDALDAALDPRFDPAERARALEARVLAIAAARAEPAGDGTPVLAFRVGGRRLAVPVEAVFQVLDARGLSALPAAPPWLLGAVAARTRAVAVLDLRVLLGLSGGGLADLAHVVVVEHAGDVFGLAAEEIEGRREVARDGREPGDGPFAWVAPGGLALLDLARVVAPER